LFYENWVGGGEWERIAVPATECARIPAEFLEEERKQMGHAAFRQEYLCEFVDGGVLMFDRELVRAAVQEVGVMEFPARVTPTLGRPRRGDQAFL